MQGTVVEHSQRAWSLTCGVEVKVRASAESVWRLLTNARAYPNWNSTIRSVEGEIRDGQRITLSVPGTERRFTPVVSGVVPNKRMTWTGGFSPIFRGVRTFELRESPDGSTTFSMTEHFSGVALLFVSRLLPDFRPIFVRFANDLKSEAEKRAAS